MMTLVIGIFIGCLLNRYFRMMRENYFGYEMHITDLRRTIAFFVFMQLLGFPIQFVREFCEDFFYYCHKIWSALS